MSKQKVTIEVDVPEGWEVDAYRPWKTGEHVMYHGNDHLMMDGPSFNGDCDIVLRRKEPLAIQACRAIDRFFESLTNPNNQTLIETTTLARKAIAEYEAGEQP